MTAEIKPKRKEWNWEMIVLGVDVTNLSPLSCEEKVSEALECVVRLKALLLCQPVFESGFVCGHWDCDLFAVGEDG